MKKWLKHILYIPKHQKPTDENILQMIAPSIMGIALCMVCLAGTSWAWFTSTVQTPPQTIESANFDISVTITDANAQPVDLAQPLQAGEDYDVMLTATGTAPSGGYCKIEGAGKTFYTEQVLPDQTQTFTFTPDTTAQYTFTSVWGEHSGKADISWDDDTTGQEQLETGDETTSLPTDAQAAAEYVVQFGDTLWEIARAQHMTVDELAAYNNISDPDSLQIGPIIKIPSEDYEIPSSPAVSEGDDEPTQLPAETEDPAANSPVVTQPAETSDEIGVIGSVDE